MKIIHMLNQLFLGGFGLNTGIQDVHNLIHKIVPILKGEGYSNKEKETIFMNYSKERKEIGLKNSNTAMKYYKTSLEIPRLLGC